mmetsp:Transcript_40382/g.116055  ORF Transcript_40382/g.116055 Transcript_40382/m.116055 type:complete len:85 (-) Transcript_40382:30-284(-)
MWQSLSSSVTLKRKDTPATIGNGRLRHNQRAIFRNSVESFVIASVLRSVADRIIFRYCNEWKKGKINEDFPHLLPHNINIVEKE